MKKMSWLPVIILCVLSWIPALATIMVSSNIDRIFAICQTPYSVSGVSMMPTFKDGESIGCDEYSEIKRYDAIIFEDYTGGIDIKRVYALPGETIRIDEDGNIYINGEIIDDPYAIHDKWDAGIAATEFTLHENEYFVLGDNRNHSKDSRFKEVGTVNKFLIYGVVIQKSISL